MKPTLLSAGAWRAQEDDGADDDVGARGGDSGLIGGGNDELLAAQREAEQQVRLGYAVDALALAAWW